MSVLPIKPKLSPLEVEKILEKNIYHIFEIISLNSKDYKSAVKRVTSLHLSGEILYDALHLEAAIKSKANTIFTLNPQHFEKLAKNEIKVIGI